MIAMPPARLAVTVPATRRGPAAVVVAVAATIAGLRRDHFPGRAGTVEPAVVALRNRAAAAAVVAWPAAVVLPHVARPMIAEALAGGPRAAAVPFATGPLTPGATVAAVPTVGGRRST